MSNRTELSEFGEFKLIDHLTQHIEHVQKSTVKGVGDDCAVIDRGDYFEVVTTDMLVESIHFDMSYTPLKHLGYKAIAVNVSDVCAMNAQPSHVTVSIAVSNRFSVEALEELYEGMLLACNQYKVDLIGGDTTSSLSGLVISITAIGQVEKDKITYRSGAKLNDLICVSGDLGAAYIGLQILEREKQIWKEHPEVQPDLEGHDYVLERFLKPEARLDIVNTLAQNMVVPTAMIDISDGLGSEVIHLCKHSNCGAKIYEDKLPIDATVANQAANFQLEPSVCALNGGEDYELLFTIKQEDFSKINTIPEIHVIGHIAEPQERASLVYPRGEEIFIQAQGWKAF